MLTLRLLKSECQTQPNKLHVFKQNTAKNWNPTKCFCFIFSKNVFSLYIYPSKEAKYFSSAWSHRNIFFSQVADSKKSPGSFLTTHNDLNQYFPTINGVSCSLKMYNSLQLGTSQRFALTTSVSITDAPHLHSKTAQYNTFRLVLCRNCVNHKLK